MEGNPLLASFRHWMIEHRGLADSTLNHYEPIVAALLDTAGGDPTHFDAGSIRSFVLNRTACNVPSSAKNVISPLRTFLRYLIAEGKCSAGLDAAIPAVACWQLSTLPRYLPGADVERIVAACDPSTPVGSRDRAIVLLLAHLGLRAGDIVGMHISDIDWQEGSIRLSGKGRREDRLPLTQEVGDAILVYLEHGRPRVPLGLDHLFLRSKAPIGPFSDSSTVSYIVAQAIRRAGVTALFRGAHVLRHSAATEMLRQEVPLQDIGTILRHRSIETTALYAKVDLALLRLVVQPWPEVMPC
jgi:site-specific recombinase XerD